MTFELQQSLQQVLWNSLCDVTASTEWFGWRAAAAAAAAATIQQQPQEQHHRLLQTGGPGGGSGTLAILIIVSILFCLVWTPTLFRRCGFPSYRDRLEAEQAEAEAIRAVLQAGEHLPDMFTAAAAASSMNHHHHHHHGMVTLEDRRDYIRNILVTKRVRKSDPTKEEEQPKERKERRKSDLYITGPLTATTVVTATTTTTPTNSSSSQPQEGEARKDDVEKATEGQQPKPEVEEMPDEERGADDSGETCPICLNEYAEGEEICWSHNRSCNHVFHQECILEWLLRHDDCPCCRHNFLSADDATADHNLHNMNRHLNNPVDDQSWGNTNLFWSPLRIPPLPRIDADEEEFWNRIHEFRHFARRYLNGPYQPNGYGTGSMEYPPSYLATRPYPTSGLSIFQLEDPSPAYSLAIGRSTSRFSTFGGGGGDLEMPDATTTGANASVAAAYSSAGSDLNASRTSTMSVPRSGEDPDDEEGSSVSSSRSSDRGPSRMATITTTTNVVERLPVEPPGRVLETPELSDTDDRPLNASVPVETPIPSTLSSSAHVIIDMERSPSLRRSSAEVTEAVPEPLAVQPTADTPPVTRQAPQQQQQPHS